MKKIATSKMIGNKRSATICGSLFIALLLTFSATRVVGQNLITNGCFEVGGVGTGFQSNYSSGSFNTQSSVNVNTGATNSTADNATYANCVDHTTGTSAGNALVVQGANFSNTGSKVYEAKPTGGIAVTNGATYTFTYWIESLTAANPANILVQFNGGAITPTLVTGSATAPNTTCNWQQVSYSFVANSGNVQIWIFNTTSTQSGFALDDISLTQSLSATASGASSICPQGTGTITATASGGRDSLTVANSCGSITPAYTYSDGGPYQSSSTFSGLAPGTYTISIADGIGDTTQSTPVTISAPPASPLSVSNDTTVDCSSSGVMLQATGGTGGYTWTPVTGLNNPNISNPTASYLATSSTTYTVSSGSPVPDVIVNGNFSAGNTGFSTQYAYIPNNSTFSQFAYSVTTAPSNFEPGTAPTYFSSCGDHTTGTGNMMVVDAASSAGKIVWSETVSVLPSSTYTFTYWIQSVSDTSASHSTQNSPASLQTTINGTTASITGTNPSAAPSTIICGNWEQVTQTWSSGANTSAIINLTDLNLAAIGNDFAIDDISFTTSATCPLTDSLVVSYTCSLPIGLVNFTATREDKGKGLLNWNTASEQNSGEFIIQRSTDGRSWTNIGSVKAAGNSNTDRQYTYADDAPANGVNYYRLQEVDLNGSYQYSPIKEITITIENTANTIKIYPNPATTGIVEVAFPSVATQQKIQLINAIGQAVMQQSVEANIGIVNLDVSQLSPGMYVVRITNNQQVSYTNLLIL
jgi:hypothetical protein